MYTYVYIYMYLCIYVCVCVCRYSVNVYICMYTYVYRYVYLCIYVCVCVCVCVCVRVYLLTCSISLMFSFIYYTMANGYGAAPFSCTYRNCILFSHFLLVVLGGGKRAPEIVLSLSLLMYILIYAYTYTGAPVWKCVPVYLCGNSLSLHLYKGIHHFLSLSAYMYMHTYSGVFFY